MEEIQDKKYWKNRPLNSINKDWNYKQKNWIFDYWKSQRHPHRKLIIRQLKKLKPFNSLIEIGCSNGPNLFLLHQNFPNIALVGVDINKLVIKDGIKRFKNAVFLEGEASKLPFPDKSFDILLTDAMLMYVSSKEIRKTIKEFLRVVRKALIFVEWYTTKSKFGKIEYRHWARDYVRLLSDYGIRTKLYKLTEEDWPSENWSRVGYIITGYL